MRTANLDQPGGRATLARAVAALVALLACGEAQAAGLRMVILVRAGQDREVAERVEGQTAELDVVVERIEGNLPPDLRGQLAIARAAGARADAVIWFGAEGGDAVVYVAERDRVVARRIAPSTGPLSRSASIEAVAVAVRTVLTGIVVARREAAAAAEDRSAPSLRAWGELGWSGLLDGAVPSGRQGVALRAGAARGRWILGAALGSHPAKTIGVAPSIEVARQHAGLLVGAELLPRARAARWSLALDLEVGAARFRRATTTAGTGFVATPAAVTWSALVSPGLRVARRVFSGAWLALELGADVLTTPPRFRVRRSTGVESLASTWACEPRLSLSLLADWR